MWALLFLAVFGFVAILQTKFYYQIPAGEYSGIAWWLAVLGVTAQLVQPISSMFLRALSEVVSIIIFFLFVWSFGSKRKNSDFICSG